MTLYRLDDLVGGCGTNDLAHENRIELGHVGDEQRGCCGNDRRADDDPQPDREQHSHNTGGQNGSSSIQHRSTKISPFLPSSGLISTRNAA